MYIRSFNDNKENLGKGNIIDNSSKTRPIILLSHLRDKKDKFRNISNRAININQIFTDKKYMYHVKDMSKCVYHKSYTRKSFITRRTKIALSEYVKHQNFIKTHKELY